MDGLISNTLGGLLMQLGIFGFLIVVVGIAFWWYLRTSKDVRSERAGIIAEKEAKITTLEDRLEKQSAEAARTKSDYEKNKLQLEEANRALYEELMDCRYPSRRETTEVEANEWEGHS